MTTVAASTRTRREAGAGRRTSAFITEPPSINLLVRPAIWVLERAMRQQFVPIRLIAWSPRLALTWLLQPYPGVRVLGERLSNIVSITAASTVRSPFCIAMNAESEPTGLSTAELDALCAGTDVSGVESFSERERIAIRYARLISETPLDFPDDFVAELTGAFSPREIVHLAATAALINHNARMFEALGSPPPVVSATAGG